MATLVSSLANYTATVEAPVDPDAAEAGKGKGSPKLGTLAGVYFPCMQNIFGVILFIRMTWIIGTAGVVQGFFIIAMCCTCVSTASRSQNPCKPIVMRGQFQRRSLLLRAIDRTRREFDGPAFVGDGSRWRGSMSLSAGECVHAETKPQSARVLHSLGIRLGAVPMERVQVAPRCPALPSALTGAVMRL